MRCTERLLLIRALLGLLAAGMVVAVIDLAACRLQRRSDCQQQTQAVAAASGAAIGWIGGVLTKSPQ